MSLLNRFLGKKADPPPVEPTKPQPPEEAAAKEPAPDAGGFMQRVRKGLQQTARILNTDVRDLFKRYPPKQ
jgi:hypothetical protein